MKDYDVKLVDHWTPPDRDDLRPLVAMPNIPKPLHGVAPRTLLGAATWNRMRKSAYLGADDTCEICGTKPDNLRQRHGHEVYEIDYASGTAVFKRVFCICSLCHLGGIHTGRAITLFKQDNPLYPKEFLLEGAEHAFKIISEYNKDHPDADLRAYATYLDYLKSDELRGPMEALIDKYNIKFYKEDPKTMAKWGDWKLVINKKIFRTPYKNEKEWQEAMEERGKKDTARMATNPFKGGVYDEIDKILKKEKVLADFVEPKVDDSTAEIVRAAIKASREDQEKMLDISNTE